MADIRCGCDRVCGDLPEDEDDRDAICKGLPYLLDDEVSEALSESEEST